MRAALLVLDPQNDFFRLDNPNLPAFQRALPAINAAIAVFRSHGMPVIFVQHTSPRKPEGSPDWQIYPAIDHRNEDFFVQKSYQNAFWQSRLEATLKSLRTDYLVLAGFTTEYCVLSTYRGARERGYKAAILREGTATLDNFHSHFVLEISATLTLDELGHALGHNRRTVPIQKRAAQT